MIYSINAAPKMHSQTSVNKGTGQNSFYTIPLIKAPSQNVSFKGFNIKNYLIWHLPGVDVVKKLEWMGHSTRFNEISELMDKIDIFVGSDIVSGSKEIYKSQINYGDRVAYLFKTKELKNKKQQNTFSFDIYKITDELVTNVTGWLSKQKGEYTFYVESEINKCDCMGIKNKIKKTIPNLTKEEFAKSEEIVINGLNQVLEQLKKTAQ